MIAKSRILRRNGGPSVNWIDGESKFWVCGTAVSKYFFMDSFDSMRIVVSDEPVKGAVRINAEGFNNEKNFQWSYVNGFGMGKSVYVYSTLAAWLRNNFSDKPVIWAWIEEA